MEAAISKPEFRQWRYTRGGANFGEIRPNRPGQKFSEGERAELLAFVRSLGLSARNDGTLIRIMHNDRKEWAKVVPIILDASRKGEKDADARAKREAQRRDEEARKAEREARWQSHPARAWIDATFGADFANTYNRLALADFLEGEQLGFINVSHKWLSGMQACNAVSDDGRPIWGNVKAAYESR